MSIRLVSREDIDKVKWNSCIHYATNGNIFGYLWYLDAMARDWDALVEGDYEAVLPLTHQQLKWRQQGLTQPPLVREMAIYSTHPPSTQRTAAFWKALPEQYKKVNLRVDTFSDVQEDGWHKTVLHNYFMPLISSYEELVDKGYSDELNDKLTTARTARLFPSTNLRPEDIAEQYRKTHPKLKDEEFHGLQRIMYNALHRGWGFASGVADSNKKLVAAAFFIFSHGRIMSFAPSVTAEGRKTFALEHLFDLMIRQQAGKPQALDFNSGPENADFATQFGAISYEYFHIRKGYRKGWFD